MGPEHEDIPPVVDENPDGGSSPTNDERTWALMAHLSYFLTFIIGVSCVAPLVIWLVKKEESKFVEEEAREALNFQLSVFLVSLALGVTICLLPAIIVVIIGAIVYAIQAATEVNKGNSYRYPHTFRLIK